MLKTFNCSLYMHMTTGLLLVYQWWKRMAPVHILTFNQAEQGIYYLCDWFNLIMATRWADGMDSKWTVLQ